MGTGYEILMLFYIIEAFFCHSIIGVFGLVKRRYELECNSKQAQLAHMLFVQYLDPLFYMTHE